MTRILALSTLGLAAACEGTPAAFEGITGTPPAACGGLYDRVEDALVEVLRAEDALETCEVPCPEGAGDVSLALLLFVDAYTEWSSCGAGTF